MNFAITTAHFTQDQINKIDPRFKPFMDKWQVTETYKGNIVTIPGSSNSSITPFNYFEVTDKPGQTENEKQLSLWCGWQGPDGNYDAEVIINLRIDGLDVLNSNAKTVKAEIIKSGGAPMRVSFNNKFFTDFTDKGWFSSTPNGYQAIPDMTVYL